jgi:hypothetical protein
MNLAPFCIQGKEMKIQALIGELRSMKEARKEDHFDFGMEVSKRDKYFAREFHRFFRKPEYQEIITSYLSPFEIAAILSYLPHEEEISLVCHYYTQFYRKIRTFNVDQGVTFNVPRAWTWLDFADRVSHNFNGKEVAFRDIQAAKVALSKPQPLEVFFTDEIIEHKGFIYVRDNTSQLWFIGGLGKQATTDDKFHFTYAKKHTFYTDSQMNYMMQNEAPRNMKAKKILAPYLQTNSVL